MVNLAAHTLLHRPLKFKVFLLPNCSTIYHQIFSTYEANYSLKLSFTQNCVVERANDLKTISNWLVLLLTWLGNLKPFLMDGNHSRTHQTHNRDIINNKYLTNLVFSVHTVGNRSPFFPLWFMAPALRAWAINRRGKNFVRNIWYGPETRLVIGIYSTWSNYFIISYKLLPLYLQLDPAYSYLAIQIAPSFKLKTSGFVLHSFTTSYFGLLIFFSKKSISVIFIHFLKKGRK